MHLGQLWFSSQGSTLVGGIAWRTHRQVALRLSAVKLVAFDLFLCSGAAEHRFMTALEISALEILQAVCASVRLLSADLFALVHFVFYLISCVFEFIGAFFYCAINFFTGLFGRAVAASDHRHGDTGRQKGDE